MLCCYTHMYKRQIVLTHTKYGRLVVYEEVDFRKNARLHQCFEPGQGI